MIYFISAPTQETAEKRARSIHAGVIPSLPIYETREAADQWAAYLNGPHSSRYLVFEISIAEQQERDAA